jgi:hypothetical protein
MCHRRIIKQQRKTCSAMHRHLAIVIDLSLKFRVREEVFRTPVESYCS